MPAAAFLPDRLAVIDTNVLLDWLVFNDPRACALARAIESGKVEGIATPPMRAELTAVIERGLVSKWRVSTGPVWAAWERYCRMIPVPPAQATGLPPRCRDASDQMFIDLALGTSARWLVSRDRALLALTGKLRPKGIEVVLPEHWSD